MFLPKNTVAGILDLPETKTSSAFASVSCASVGSLLNTGYKALGRRRPDSEAMYFYTLNHLTAMIRAEYGNNNPLPQWAIEVVNQYASVLTEQARRMFWYVTIITTREARHNKIIQDGDYKKAIASKSNNVTATFIKNLSNLSEDSAITSFMTAPPSVPFSVYLNGLVSAFDDTPWSSGYGGEAWGSVTKALRSVILGETSLEMFVDTAYSLAHNNGPIFNKGYLYDSYSDKFGVILDVQRAGQMPNLILAQDNIPTLHYTTSARTALEPHVVKVGHEIKPFAPFVDWFAVEAAGALHADEFSGLKDTQIQKFGATTKAAIEFLEAKKAMEQIAADKAAALVEAQKKMAEIKAAKQAKLDAKVKAAAAMAEAAAKAKFHVFPGMTVTKITRGAA